MRIDAVHLSSWCQCTLVKGYNLVLGNENFRSNQSSIKSKCQSSCDPISEIPYKLYLHCRWRRHRETLPEYMRWPPTLAHRKNFVFFISKIRWRIGIFAFSIAADIFWITPLTLTSVPMVAFQHCTPKSVCEPDWPYISTQCCSFWEHNSSLK